MNCRGWAKRSVSREPTDDSIVGAEGSDQSRSLGTAQERLRPPHAGRCLPRGDDDAREHQHVADEVKQPRLFAEQQDRHRRAEHRHQMQERRGAVRPDQRDAAVEEQIRQRRGKDHDIDQGRDRQGVEFQRGAGRVFPDRERQQQQRAAADGEGNQRQLMRLRPPRHQRRIQPETQQRAGEHHVALVEPDAGKRAEIAAQDDGEHAGQRDRDAGELRPGQPHAEQRQRPQRHEQRPGRLDQERVQRLGVLQRPVGQRVVEGKSGRRQHHHQRQPRPQGRPVALQMRPGERQQHEERADPADAGQRHRRHMAGDVAREHDIAGPEQRGQAQQQIGLVVEPPDRIGGRRRWRGNRHRFGRSCAGFTPRDKCRARNATMPEIVGRSEGAGNGRGFVEYRGT